jgi:23S rRNA pseudouridine1911/1915/1917 synthase
MTPYTRKGEWLEFTMDRMQQRALADVLEGCQALTDADKFAVENITSIQLPIPKKWIKRLQKDEGIQLFQNRCRVKLFPKEAAGFPAHWMELDILYEDDFCLVVNKPAGVKVHPTEAGESQTLAGGIAAYYEAAQINTAVKHVHRLDEWTSGPVLYAKNAFALDQFDEAMRQKQIHRNYAALVKGTMQASEQGRLDYPIGRDRHHNIRRRVSAKGQYAVTHYQVEETFKQASRVRLQLETGRTHQIRVHLSHIGHPILGDALYGGPVKEITRQALHGESLRFLHPWDKDWLTIEAPWPQDMLSLLEDLSKK